MIKLLKTIIKCVSVLTILMSFQQLRQFNCKLYRQGKFSSFIYNRSGLGHWRRQEIFIDRSDSIETDVVEMTPFDTIFYRIKWTENCKYTLQFIKATNKTADSIIRYYSEPRDLEYVIQEGGDTYYIQTNRDKTDTIWIRQ